MFKRVSFLWLFLPVLLVCPVRANPDPALARVEQVRHLLEREHLKAVLPEALSQAALNAVQIELAAEGEAPEDALETIFAHHPERSEQLARAALHGMLELYEDHYTAFLDPGSYRSQLERMSVGPYGSLGMYVVQDDPFRPPVVIEVVSGPAYEAGVRPGDSILAVDGEDASRMGLDAVREQLGGKVGREVALQVRGQGQETRELQLRCREIDVRTVESRTLFGPSGPVGYLRVRSFVGSTPSEARRALEGFATNRVILDLRNNGGGYVTSAVALCSLFLPRAVRVVTVKRRSGPGTVHGSSGQTVGTRKRVVVLINENSASAAELTAAALAEHGVAVLVGEHSFGKGSVQKTIPLSGGSALRLTTAHYLTPKGRDLNGVGLTPDILVPMPVEQLGSAEDTQLKRALEVVSR